MHRPRNFMDKQSIEAGIRNNTLPVFADSNGLITRGTRDDDSDDAKWVPYRSDLNASVGKNPATKHKAGSKPVKHQPVKAHKDSETPAALDHVDLTRSDEESASDTTEPGSRSPTTKYLSQARQEFTTTKPPFARGNKNILASRKLTLASANGGFPQLAVPAVLVTRAWDSKLSYYTIDCNDERLIVRPYGTRHGTQYRAWSGQGNAFENRPVAFAVIDDVEDQDIDDKASDNDLETSLDNVTTHHQSHSAKDGDYVPTTSETSSLGDQAQKQSGLSGTTTETESPQPSATNWGQLRHLNASHDDGATRGPEENPGNGPVPAPCGRFSLVHPSPAEPSIAVPRISEVAAGKRPATEYLDDDRFHKRVHPDASNTINTSTVARIPSTLTPLKQERTVLFISLPGSTADITPIKLRSAMTLASFFSSVCAVAGIPDYEHLAVAVMLQQENWGPDRSLVLKRGTVEAFEFFLENVDEAPCWNEEGGRLSFLLHLRF